MLREIPVKSTKRNELIDITSEVEAIVSESKVKAGLCVVSVPHTTAGIIVNENADPSVKTDLLSALDALVPGIDFAHIEGNSDAHFKSTLVGQQKIFPIEKGKLVLGTWQGITFAEFDGPRNRKAIVKIV